MLWRRWIWRDLGERIMMVCLNLNFDKVTKSYVWKTYFSAPHGAFGRSLEAWRRSLEGHPSTSRCPSGMEALPHHLCHLSWLGFMSSSPQPPARTPPHGLLDRLGMCRCVTGALFALPENQLGHNSKKLFGFGRLRYVSRKKIWKWGVLTS